MKNHLAKLFTSSLEDPIFKEVLNLVRMNSEGKIWVVGGFVYRNIAAKMNSTPSYNYDIDFIVENRNEKLEEVPGWRLEVNSYGNQNYVRDNNEMSFWTLNKTQRFGGKQIQTIGDYLQDTPLNIQSIAYDLESGELLGEKGMEALTNKVIAINSHEQAKFYAKRKQKTLNEIITKKAKELDFEAIFV